MLKFSANLTMLFNEVGFLDRFEMAAKAGFRGVEFMFPYEFARDAISEKLNQYGLEVVLHNIPAGNWAGGERGIACLPDRVGEFQNNVELAIEYAKALKSPCLNCMAGLFPPGAAPEKVRQTLLNNLRFAADALAKEKIRLLIEPINTTDMPGFYLNHTQQALEIMQVIKHPNIWLQYDIYHMQVMEGNLINNIRSNIGRIGHLQLADNPGRHEPGTGEINFPNVFKAVSEAGYTGWIGCEYKPSGNTTEGLNWIQPYRKEGING